MTIQHVDVSETDGVGWVTLKRPEASNRINTEMYAELIDAFAAVQPPLTMSENAFEPGECVRGGRLLGKRIEPRGMLPML